MAARRSAAGGAADDADEAADAADVGAAGEEGGEFGAGVEGLGLDADGGHQPPVTGGKKAISSPSWMACRGGEVLVDGGADEAGLGEGGGAGRVAAREQAMRCATVATRPGDAADLPRRGPCVRAARRSRGT